MPRAMLKPASSSSTTAQITNAAQAGNLRPKFSKRPASFTTATDEASPPPPAVAVTPPQPVQPAPTVTTLPWQEDLRFGIALVILLVVVNALLSYLMPLIASPASETTIETSLVTHPMLLPARDKASAIRTYAQPEDQQSLKHQLDLRDYDDTALSVSAEEVPPPKAQPLDADRSLEANVQAPEQPQ